MIKICPILKSNLNFKAIMILFILLINIPSISATTPHGNTSLFIDKSIYPKLIEGKKVYVNVELKDHSGLNYVNTKTKKEKLDVFRNKLKENSKVLNKLLSSLKSSEFELDRIALDGRGFY